MSIIDSSILNKWKSCKYNIIKYNQQSSPYNQAMQNNYINNIGISNQLNNNTVLENNNNILENIIANNISTTINPYFITFSSENNMTDN